MGSMHQLRADLPAQFSDKVPLSADSLPSPSPLSLCPFLSLSSALAQKKGTEGGRSAQGGDGEKGDCERFLGNTEYSGKLDADAAIIPGYVYVDSGMVRGTMLASGLTLSVVGAAWVVARFQT